MPTFFPKILLTSTAGIVLTLATVVCEGESAVAVKVPAFSVAKSSISKKLVLTQVVQSSPVSVAVKIPEPSMLAGLGLVACSLVVTRRRLKN